MMPMGAYTPDSIVVHLERGVQRILFGQDIQLFMWISDWRSCSGVNQYRGLESSGFSREGECGVIRGRSRYCGEPPAPDGGGSTGEAFGSESRYPLRRSFVDIFTQEQHLSIIPFLNQR
jgi:hypothetical protein